MKFKIGLGVIGLCVLTGCGGGGGSSSRAAAPLATKTRIYQSGDKWVYTVTGQTTNPGSATVTEKGTLTLSLAAQTFNGGPVLALNYVLAVSASNGQTANVTSTIYLVQDSTTGDILEVGDTNGPTLGSGGLVSGDGSGGINTPRTLLSPVVLFPGTWTQGLAKSATLQFSNSDTQTYNLNVTGTEVVQTPIGAFNAWIANAGADIGVTEDWAPQIGAPVRVTLQQGDAATGAVTLTAVLSSTTVAH